MPGEFGLPFVETQPKPPIEICCLERRDGQETVLQILIYGVEKHFLHPTGCEIIISFAILIVTH